MTLDPQQNTTTILDKVWFAEKPKICSSRTLSSHTASWHAADAAIYSPFINDRATDKSSLEFQLFSTKKNMIPLVIS